MNNKLLRFIFGFCVLPVGLLVLSPIIWVCTQYPRIGAGVFVLTVCTFTGYTYSSD